MRGAGHSTLLLTLAAAAGLMGAARAEEAATSAAATTTSTVQILQNAGCTGVNHMCFGVNYTHNPDRQYVKKRSEPLLLSTTGKATVSLTWKGFADCVGRPILDESSSDGSYKFSLWLDAALVNRDPKTTNRFGPGTDYFGEHRSGISANDKDVEIKTPMVPLNITRVISVGRGDHKFYPYLVFGFNADYASCALYGGYMTATVLGK